MRVLLFSQYFWPESFGITSLVKTLSSRGVATSVLTGKPNYPQGEIFEGYKAWGCQQEVHQGVCINRIPLFPRGQRAWRLALNYLSFVFSGLIFAPAIVRGRKFDAIFVYAPSPIIQAIPAIFIGWLTNSPVVLWVQDLWPESLSATGYVKNRGILKLVELVVRFIYRHVDLLLVQSEAFVGPVSMLASGTPVKYYPNSVDQSFSSPPSVEVPDVAGLGQGFSVMFAGNIGTAQAVEVIVEAASLLREFEEIRFVVFGDGSRRSWMLQEVRNRNLQNLHVPGRFPVETMPGFMQKASALLVTLADQPIFAATVPNKVQAYMASGRPIVACMRGEGARLVADSGAGLAVPVEDAPALAEAILRLHNMSPAEREAMGENGRAYFEAHFDHEHLVDQLVELLHQVSQESGRVQ